MPTRALAASLSSIGRCVAAPHGSPSAGASKVFETRMPGVNGSVIESSSAWPVAGQRTAIAGLVPGAVRHDRTAVVEHDHDVFDGDVACAEGARDGARSANLVCARTRAERAAASKDVPIAEDERRADPVVGEHVPGARLLRVAVPVPVPVVDDFARCAVRCVLRNDADVAARLLPDFPGAPDAREVLVV